MKKRLAFILVAFGILGFSLGNEVLAADTAPASATMATDSDV
ncbi:TPA: phospholipase, partial [Streptococcus equi subsp. equi]|nr:phospholipase [Streptococcus equi subsp. equi]